MTEAHPDIQRAVELLKAGELVAFPTETVYGLGADAMNPAAVAKIFAVKGRPADHPLIVHIPDASQLDRWAREISPAARAVAEKFWPGPLTLILKRHPDVPDCVTGGQDTVGLRVPNHPLALALLRAFGGGIAAPSANKFGRISPTTAQHVRDDLGDAVAMILDGGPCAVGIESTIVDMSSERTTILRPGMISAFDIGIFLGRMPAEKGNAHSVKTPGSHLAHYAPRTPLLLVPDDTVAVAVRTALGKGEKIAVLAPYPAPIEHPLIVAWQVAPTDATAYAHALYATLRTLDAAGADLIIVQRPPWPAVIDRLMRASAGSGT
ncbi:L-threonylcarbamoyladenylate synthase [Sulfuricystis thermophila]|uniref:L-threonylcarbamoyladenylate synthase n=1 Tax=Sulfuricystis thermophila TaxID=2496847 RepID=UPI00103551E3|nr:L-threonylcarbamoyladenylate synthase [Sulfuricystis thermophila]